MVTAIGADRAGDVTDSEIIQASWQAPDRFGALHHRHLGALYTYAFQRVGPAAAEDVVADTFLAAFSQRHRYDLSRDDARPWLFGILTNLIARHGRAEKIHYRAHARAWHAPVVDGLAERVAEQVSAEAMRARLAAALCRLRRADRDVLLLVAWGQLSYDEVAQALNIPIGTVASRLNRARRTVRETLANPDSSAGKQGNHRRERTS
jgi:RNA polymerase sigma-70 factor (ECF subfamily)